MKHIVLFDGHFGSTTAQGGRDSSPSLKLPTSTGAGKAALGKGEMGEEGGGMGTRRQLEGIDMAVTAHWILFLLSSL